MTFYFAAASLASLQDLADKSDKTGEMTKLLPIMEFADDQEAKQHYLQETLLANTYYQQGGHPKDRDGVPREQLGENIYELTNEPRLLEMTPAVIDTIASYFGGKATPATPHVQSVSGLKNSLLESFTRESGMMNYWLENFVSANWLSVNDLLLGGYDGFKTDQQICVTPKFAAKNGVDFTTRGKLEETYNTERTRPPVSKSHKEVPVAPRTLWDRIFH